MNKRFFLISMAVVALAILGGVFVYTNAPKTEIFSGIDAPVDKAGATECRQTEQI